MPSTPGAMPMPTMLRSLYAREWPSLPLKKGQKPGSSRSTKSTPSPEENAPRSTKSTPRPEEKAPAVGRRKMPRALSNLSSLGISWAPGSSSSASLASGAASAPPTPQGVSATGAPKIAASLPRAVQERVEGLPVLLGSSSAKSVSLLSGAAAAGAAAVAAVPAAAGGVCKQGLRLASASAPRRSGQQSRRVRRQGSDLILKSGVTATAAMSEGKEVAELCQRQATLSPEDNQFLLWVLRKHFLFQDLEECQRNDITIYMHRQEVSAGEVICSQGEVGDCCYLIQGGSFEVSMDGRKVKRLYAGHTFGELAMLYSVNRTATVSCSEEGVLWRMDGGCFRLCMGRLVSKHLQMAMDFLSMDEHFKGLQEPERKLLAGACSVQKFGRGESLLREGEAHHCLFIIASGHVEAVDSNRKAALRKAGAIFGPASKTYEQIITVKAIDDVTCLVVPISSMERLIGPVEDVFRRTAIKALLHGQPGPSKFGEAAFFGQLTDQQQDALVDRFELVTYEAGDVIVESGSRGQFVVIVSGRARVIAGDACTGFLTDGMTFGAAALVNNAPIQESLVASERTRVQRVTHDAVADALGQSFAEVLRANEVQKALADIRLFKNLSDQQLKDMTKCFESCDFKSGEVIVRQGDEAGHFYLIRSGGVGVWKDGARLRSLGRWDYFGERGLLLQERRSATCTAEESSVCLRLDKAVFQSIVGLFREELEKRMAYQDVKVSMSDLRVKAIVGKGNFGIVKLVYHKDDDQCCYALKCVSKAQVVQQKQQKAIAMEREVNAQCYHPCVVQFVRTFQDSENVYILTEFLGGGELFCAIREIGKLTKKQAQFFGASIVLGLEYLHARGFMYRDLKPENVMLDARGYAKLVDFGCCKKATRTSTLVGTPEYMAPEVISMMGYSCAIDWWALGVVMYELVVGPLPFGGDAEDQLALFHAIRHAPLRFPSTLLDGTATSVISGLLQRTPELRMGASRQGAQEIREHPYFAELDWHGLAGRYLPPPWVPNTKTLEEDWQICHGEAVGKGDDSGGLMQSRFVTPFSRRHKVGMEWAEAF